MHSYHAFSNPPNEMCVILMYELVVDGINNSNMRARNIEPQCRPHGDLESSAFLSAKQFILLFKR